MKKHALSPEDNGIPLKEKKVLVVGLGISGVSACRFLKRHHAKIFATDKKSRSALKSTLKKVPSGVRVETGNTRFLNKIYDLIVVSPGVPWDSPFLVRARKRGIPILPEFELGWRYLKPLKTVAVTGTNGKTTTTALLGHILKKARRPCWVAGNIGTPLTSCIRKPKAHLILETSSYQLEAHRKFHPDIGIWLNLSPDHLGRHKTLAGYAKAKTRMFLNCSSRDIAILNRQDPWCRKKASSIRAKKLWFPAKELKGVSRFLRLPGHHNQENAMAAVAAAKELGIDQNIIKKALVSFPGVSHRLQSVGVKNTVEYINDSKSTNVDSTRVALKAMKKGVLLILGGEHKGSSYKKLGDLLKKKVSFVLGVGQAQNLIQKELQGLIPVINCGNMKAAVQWASRLAQKGETVLLSPACASFDQYKNFEERGRHFMQLVKNLN